MARREALPTASLSAHEPVLAIFVATRFQELFRTKILSVLLGALVGRRDRNPRKNVLALHEPRQALHHFVAGTPIDECASVGSRSTSVVCLL